MNKQYNYNEQLEQFFLYVENINIDNYGAEYILKNVRDLPIQDILLLIRDSKYPHPLITPGNIPQFSQFYDYENVLRIVMDSGEKDISFEMLGYYLEGKRSIRAMVKYGENHYKLASQMGLVTSGKHRENTFLGSCYHHIKDEEIRHMIGCKLCLRIPVIWKIMFLACIGPVDISAFLGQYLSPSTAMRRKSNIRKILKLLQGYDTEERQYIYKNIR